MSVLTHEVANRLRRLADTLASLRLQVREAVAGETARAVGDAVRELLTAALDGRLGRVKYRNPSREWDDDHDSWRDDDVRRVETMPAPWNDDGEAMERKAVRSRRWSAALAFAATTVRCWAARRVPAWAALALGTLAGVAAWTGGHLARTGLALLAAVGDLFPPLEPAHWAHDHF